ncbi:protein ULTRAPETALA 2 isoform X2 [Ricinus communis]|uniref:protein ULTRAPETALA 2 isoform X2 n=1 Tax=Ricinus communis TaxID=3988 RepID=UPI0007724E01|nr:protein ULTRAPETALA 2 isoform X2 [Ricinus communis]|eukprot:XP_002533710.2 protein ULTRAPETALA 2 [Ricinus communis]
MAQGRNGEMEIEVMLSETLFLEKELKDIDGFKRGTDYVEVTCGCTSRRYGDSMATLRVYASGKFLINCNCIPGCEADRMTPYEFEKHAEREGTSRWTSHIWVLIRDKKVPLWRTPLLKYYKHTANGASGSMRRNFHRDEFIRCSKCKKDRRFRLRNKEECRMYHDALLKKRWTCDDKPYDIITCKDEEERASRKNCRGCPRSSLCKGCTSCVCFGCLKCRFVDCSCRTCVDFMQNASPN